MLENSTKSDDDLCKIAVAPYAGAWIETYNWKYIRMTDGSLPMRERGLKLMELIYLVATEQSLPMRERGLKPRPYNRHTA